MFNDKRRKIFFSQYKINAKDLNEACAINGRVAINDFSRALKRPASASNRRRVSDD